MGTVIQIRTGKSIDVIKNIHQFMELDAAERQTLAQIFVSATIGAMYGPEKCPFIIRFDSGFQEVYDFQGFYIGLEDDPIAMRQFVAANIAHKRAEKHFHKFIAMKREETPRLSINS